MSDGTIDVHFLHPRDSRSVTAELSPHCTAAQAIQSLMADDGSGAFLASLPQGQVYQLAVRRGDQAVSIPPNTTFAQAGVMHGDSIEVGQAGQGA